MAIQDKFNSKNVIYKITSDVDLEGGTLTVPAGCTLDFQGGSINNGTVRGNGAYVSGETSGCSAKFEDVVYFTSGQETALNGIVVEISNRMAEVEDRFNDSLDDMNLKINYIDDKAAKANSTASKAEAKADSAISTSNEAANTATIAKNAVATLEGLADADEAQQTLAAQVVQIEENKQNIALNKAETDEKLTELASEVGSYQFVETYLTNYKKTIYPFKKGWEYYIELIEANNTDHIQLSWIKEDGSIVEGYISSFSVGVPKIIIPDMDYIGVYGGYNGTAKLRISQKAVKDSSLENREDIEKNVSNIYKINEYVNALSKEYTETGYHEVNFKKGYSYELRYNSYGGQYGDFGYKVDEDSEYVKIATIDFYSDKKSVIFTPKSDIKYFMFSVTANSVTNVSITPVINILDLIRTVDEKANKIDGKVDLSYTQLIDVNNIIDGTGVNSYGKIFEVNESWKGTYGLVVLEWRNEEYITINCAKASGGFYICQYDKDDKFITGSSITGTGLVTISKYSDKAAFVKVTINPSANDIMANYGTILLPYESKPNPIAGYIKDIDFSKKSTVLMYAYADGDIEDTDTKFYGWKNGKCAIQRAIDACDGNTHTKIFCKGSVIATDAEQFTLQENGYYNVVFIPHNKNNIELIGEGEDKTMIEVSLPDDFEQYNIYQPLEVWGDNSVVRGMTIISKNCRYCIHMDASAYKKADYHTISFFDVTMRHYPNAKKAFEASFGLGISNGMNLLTERCTFIVETEYTPSLYIHENVGFNEDFVWTIKNCRFEQSQSTSKTKAIKMMTIQTLGSGVHGNIVFENNEIGMNVPIFVSENNNSPSKQNIKDYDANIYIKITGYYEHPIGYFVSNSTSSVLRITSKTTGENSSVRFDSTSSAFNLIVKGLLRSGYTENNGVVHVEGYQYRDGAEGLNGYAMGELAIDTNRICSMQNRLGDCSSSPKELIVIIDSVSYSIQFNKNYTSYSDEDMLAEIANVIGEVANVELYNWGSDYFPEIHPSLCCRINGSETSILRGMGVKITSNGLKIATTDNEVDAISIDDIPPLKYGRVVRKAILSIYEKSRHHVKLEQYAVTNNDKYTGYFQNRFGIGDTAGVFVPKENGVLTSDYWGYLTINK